MELLDKQNERKSLWIQTTARLLYNKADNIDMVQWIIVLALPVLKMFFVQNILLNYIMMIWFLVSFVLDYFIDKYTDIATELRKSFDYYVYGWNNDFQEKLVDISKIYQVRNKKYFEHQTVNSGTDKPKGVKNWYTTVKKEMSQEEAVKSAMKENIYFDKRINNVAFLCILIFVSLLLLVLSTSGFTLYEVFFGLFITFASFTKKLYSTFVNLKKVSSINSNIENLLRANDIDLTYLQSEIDKKRSIPRTSNQLVYFFKTKKIHEEVSEFRSDV
uniref:Uncharacterized protein n=1 Tax=Carnobacterium maltaromaticum TaxID=2751 RepID=A0A1Z5AWY2_CARML|nr:S-4TM family putative pore-forming effector [Carnobacterium maltaromaticum]CRI06582.1 membrane protein of unknown function [Carnobacterium maltaromaticum]